MFGEGKIYWLQQLVEEQDIDLARSWFYTDSITDVPLLELVGHPVVVNPDPMLFRTAVRRSWPVRVFDDPAQALEGADVVMVLRIQRERLEGALLPSLREYARTFGIGPRNIEYAKPDAIVMHPGPMNRGVEIDSDIADDIDRSLIQEQVEMGVAVRMACLDMLCRPKAAVVDG